MFVYIRQRPSQSPFIPIFYRIRRGNFPHFFPISPFFSPIFSQIFPIFSHFPHFFPQFSPPPERNIYEYLNIFGIIPLFPGNSPHPEAGGGRGWNFWDWGFFFWAGEGRIFLFQRGKFGNCGGNFPGEKEDLALPGIGTEFVEFSWTWNGINGIFMDLEWTFPRFGMEFPGFGMEFLRFGMEFPGFGMEFPGFGTESVESSWSGTEFMEFPGLGTDFPWVWGWNPWNSPRSFLGLCPECSRMWGWISWNFPGISPEFGMELFPGLGMEFLELPCPAWNCCHPCPQVGPAGAPSSAWGHLGTLGTFGDTPGAAQRDRSPPRAVLRAPRRPHGGRGPLGTVRDFWGQRCPPAAVPPSPELQLPACSAPHLA
ncbi:uncharacterized protein LOC121359181 [Pyrgilauda ruficollis]|uniref:uncharacterized protein LOC121359181 n=1 Tax=Pyrgilauda ruficollis TaxID=221976 RepID=UPI001B87D253|nr:uncharacterized protein LOC121359181 [Pyrgilauda ruficollis]